MARVDLSTHHHRHQLLRLLWLEAPSIYGILTPTEQWNLHELYRPSEHLIEADLAEHLAGLRQTNPSLASKVGKSFKLIARVHELLAEYDIPLSDHQAVARAIQPFDRARALHLLDPPDVSRGKGRQARHIHVRAIVKPEIDVHQLSRALIALTLHQQKEASTRDLPPRSEDDSRAA